MNLANTINRPRDISFAIDQLAKANSDNESPLHGRLDLGQSRRGGTLIWRVHGNGHRGAGIRSAGIT
jgi:hypothetical protein